LADASRSTSCPTARAGATVIGIRVGAGGLQDEDLLGDGRASQALADTERDGLEAGRRKHDHGILLRRG